MKVVLVKVHLAPWWNELFKTDRIEILTDVYTPFSQLGPIPEPLKLEFTVRAGTAIEYVKQHFPEAQLEIIPVSHCPTCWTKNPEASPQAGA
jgi:hypothetical protein